MRATSFLAVTFAACFGAVLPAQAQERSFNFALNGGLKAIPSYPGADSFDAAPDFGFEFGALNWGRVNLGRGIGVEADPGLSFRGALKVIGERDPADHPELAGLKDIDTAVEVGFGIVYRQTNWEAFGEVRQGFGGHDGVTGTLGMDLVFRPSDRFTLRAGPRLNLGDQNYAETYFGVSAAEAGASRFGAFDAGGGVLGAGLQVKGTYDLNERWAIEGLLNYEQLQNDAADSPITAIGSKDQWSVSLGLKRTFTVRF